MVLKFCKDFQKLYTVATSLTCTQLVYRIRALRLFRSFRFGGFVSPFRVLVHAQFFFKICKTDFKIVFKIPIFDIFVDIQKALLQIFVFKL